MPFAHDSGAMAPVNGEAITRNLLAGEMSDEYEEWLRLAEEAFDDTAAHRNPPDDVRFNAWSEPVAWLAHRRQGR